MGIAVLHKQQTVQQTPEAEVEAKEADIAVVEDTDRRGWRRRKDGVAGDPRSVCLSCCHDN